MTQSHLIVKEEGCTKPESPEIDKEVSRLQKESAEQDHAILALQEENRRLNIQLSNYAYQIDRAKRDRDEAQFKVMELEKELERLKFNSQ